MTVRIIQFRTKHFRPSDWAAAVAQRVEHTLRPDADVLYEEYKNGGSRKAQMKYNVTALPTTVVTREESSDYDYVSHQGVPDRDDLQSDVVSYLEQES